MVFLIERDCRCCERGAKKFRVELSKEELKSMNDHCESCWKKWHNKGVANDFEERGVFNHLEKVVLK
mgnify:CR=1 FL=1